ncbi:predicted protein [Nematostella vectensis]|uniref:Rrn7/TAF1B C-terminal cyclin domain-containing protein n=1 Tax=Nematostella vectensis TaxID=45351 RepID=A7RIH9_NEMVE|nr:predicted protein [Nematostella vectensis]|eukprot:XP_001640874.1 predicted protein [Nematostella vectensis]
MSMQVTVGKEAEGSDDLKVAVFGELGWRFPKRDLQYLQGSSRLLRHAREEMLAEIEFDNNISRAIEKKKKPGRPRLPREKGKPWLMQEAIQFILKAQVKFLVSKGIQPELKDIVGQIWFAYLRKKKLAFFENPPSPSEILKKGRQQKHAREEMLAEIEFDNNISRAIEKKKKPGRPRLPREKGKPWLMQEAIQFILKAQVKFLVSKGIQPELKDIVGQIWFAYLRKKKLAFFENPPSPSEILKKGRQHESKRNKNRKKELSDTESELPELCSEFDEESCYSGDKPTKAEEKTEDLLFSDSDTEDDKSGDENIGSLNSNSRQNKSLCLRTTVAIIYLALLQLNEPTFLSDIIRFQEALSQTTDEAVDTHNTLPLWSDWASCAQACQSKRREAGVPWTDEELRETRDPRTYGTFCKTAAFGSWASRDPEMLEGKAAIPAKKRWIKEGSFPYFGGTRFLPNYMKLSHSDSRALSLNCVPMRQHVLMNARSIARTLNIKSFPQQDLKIYISRYILDLNLPGIIHGFVHRLMQILTPLFSVFGKTLQRNDYELAAMAYILMAVKLCYGLDDKNDNSKRFQEALSQTTDEAVDTHNTLPLWSDWASCAQACQSKRREAGVPWTDEELRETRDPRTYGTFCKTAAFGSWASRDPEMLEGKAAIPAKKRSVRKERWNNCAEIFSNLVATPEAPCTDQHTTTSFPTACRHATDDTNDCFHTTRDRRLSLESTSKLCSERSVSRETDDESCQQFRRYVCYLRPGSFMNTRPSSYDFLLRLLSSRIEARPEDLEKLLVKLESAMFAISQGKELPNYGSRRF